MSAEGAEWDEDEVLLTPQPSSGSMFFTVSIPKRIQQEILLFEDVATGSEEFRVLTFFNGDFPVTFVVPQKPTVGADASQAVRVVREFMIKEAELHRDDDTIQFTFVGPSPFHADCALVRGQAGQAAPFAVTHIPQLGYDRYVFAANPAKFPALPEAAAYLFQELSFELSIFYYLVRQGNLRLKLAGDLKERASELIAMHTRQGFRGTMSRLFRAGSHARLLSLDLIALEYGATQEHAAARERIRTYYDAERSPAAFRWASETEADRTQLEDVQLVREFVTLLESRRTRETEWAALVLASLLGGVAGGVITAVVK